MAEIRFEMINTLVRKFFILKEEGFLVNANYQTDLESLLCKEELALFNEMLNAENLDKGVDAIKKAYTNSKTSKQFAINILSEPKITQIATILLAGANEELFEKAISLRENTDKNSVNLMNIVKSLESKLLTFLISRISKLPKTTSPDDYMQTLNTKELGIDVVSRYFGGDFEKAYIDDKGIGKSYYDFLRCKVLVKHNFMRVEDAQKLLLLFIWNAIPAFRTKTRLTSVGSTR